MLQRRWNPGPVGTAATLAAANVLKRVAEDSIHKLSNAKHASSGFTAQASKWSKKAKVGGGSRTVASKSFTGTRSRMANSSGKFSSGKRIKRGSRKAKRNYGITATVEVGGTLTDANAIYVGHSSLPGYQVLLTMVQSLVKTLVLKTYNIEIRNIVDNWSEFLIPKIEILYYTSASSAILGSISVTPINTDTYYATCVSLTGLICTQILAQPQTVWKFMRFYTIPVGNTPVPCELDLEFTKVNVYVKSSLKVQNRSVTVVGNQEADDVDNVPLYGKSYTGRGTGLLIRDTQRQNNTSNSFGSDVRHGLMAYVAATDLSQSLREPPVGTIFANAKRSGKVKLEPGSIKSSVLTFKKNISFNSMIQMMVPQLCGFASGLFRQYSQVGNCRVFAMEKILDDGAGGNIVAAYEINDNISVGLFSWKPRGTMNTYIKY